MRKLAGALLLVATFATTADAQEVTTALSISSVGSGSGNGPYPSAEFRASLPASDSPRRVEPVWEVPAASHCSHEATGAGASVAPPSL